MSPAPAADKRSLRIEALARRGEVEPHVRAQFSARLAKFGLEMAQRLHASAISAFHPIHDEPDTLALLGALAEHGFRTALPITVARGAPSSGSGMLIAPALDPDLMFVPLACFDRRGHRIGYGAGHYDRTLEGLRAKGSVTAIGVAYSASEVAVLPDEPHDQRLDYVLTEHDLFDCRTA